MKCPVCKAKDIKKAYYKGRLILVTSLPHRDWNGEVVRVSYPHTCLWEEVK